MRTMASRLSERRERETLDRLSWLLRDTVLESKLGMHDDPSPSPVAYPPAGLSACLAGGLAFSAPLLKDRAESDGMSRRRFLSRGPIVAGGVAAGLLLAGETQQAQSAYWGGAYSYGTRFVRWGLTRLFSYLADWCINRVMNYAFRCGPAYDIGLTKTDVSEVAAARPIAGATVHNSFATPVEITNTDKHRDETTVGKLTLGIKRYVTPFEPSVPEMIQQDAEVEKLKEDRKPVPAGGRLATTKRYTSDLTKNARWEPAFKKMCTAYGYKSGDFVAEYINGWADSAGKEYLCIAGRVGKVHKIMYARTRPADSPLPKRG